MNKKEFLAALRCGLAGLSRRETEERLAFYREMIDDRMEEGLTEEEAVRAVGTPAEIAAAVRSEAVAASEGKGGRRPRVWLAVLLILGSPVWFSLLVSALAVLFSLYVTLWSLVISFWAVTVSLAAGAVAGVFSPLLLFLGSTVTEMLALLFLGIASAGLAILFFLASLAATRGAVALMRRIPHILVKCFKWEATS
ncbi:MAG: DUF1700 domain-containing protein [Clostridia bacterium]|nr:DUF1700 domain-containing protein [Clostridia bacterium]